MQVISSQAVPIKAWVEHITDIESQAIDQLKNMANLPFVFKHVAVMPDVHLGKGATVGSVIATRGAVVPAAVGVDIGCGMMAVKTELDADIVQDKIAEIRHSIERSVPVAHRGNKELCKRAENMTSWWRWGCDGYMKDAALFARAQSQLGTLGGGNHFIEVCLDEYNFVWIMLHSGSRNVGKTLAERHISEAKGLMRDMFIKLPDPDLAYFVQQTEAYDLYMNDLHWCQEYAALNRVEMMERVLKDIAYAVLGGPEYIERIMEVNCHHNYSAMENHFGENVLVTRKGAVRARSGDWGIIPGSMGTRSYIVKGKGNADSFHSCSHGAGRRMSRTQAKKQFTVDDLIAQTEGVDCRKDAGVVDEIPGAYKDIDTVMANQDDLVTIVATLRAIACVKG